ncbi:unnamed protein product [Pedinophyceae sp. YPF-701]|nr:unnamed protein product [Pedinophyceae sp. YPF-701]
MCITGLVWDSIPGILLLLLSNRDELLDRPTARAAFWDDHPNIFGGRDLGLGGTWLALSRSGRVCSLTNVRVPADRIKHGPSVPSRGELVPGFLEADRSTSPAQHLGSLQLGDNCPYNHYSLLAGDLATRELAYVCSDGQGPWENGNGACRSSGGRTVPSNTDREGSTEGGGTGGVLRLERGVHALSNGHLGSRWPKTERLRARLDGVVERMRAGGGVEGLFGGLEGLHDELVGVMLDEGAATGGDDGQLPCGETGWGPDTERLLDRIYIPPAPIEPLGGQLYGTMVTQVITVDTAGRVVATERFRRPGGAEVEVNRVEFEVDLTGGGGGTEGQEAASRDTAAGRRADL